KACVLPENPASYRVVRTKSYLFNKAPENIKVRFFIPEAKLGKFKIGSKVKLICDGCAEPIAGVINYISPEAEFTPPVIYSTKRREKLIFMAEAIPALQQAGRMKIGQPFDVEIIGDE
ncbi:HlyD family efflux transporter periplasmic adaptor subunit, partial [Klebsiella pneumoniae]